MLSTERERLNALIEALAKEVSTEPLVLHLLLKRKDWQRLSQLFYADEWQHAAKEALQYLSDYDHKLDKPHMDYSNVLQLFFDYKLAEEQDLGVSLHNTASLLSELTLKGLSSDSE